MTNNDRPSPQRETFTWLEPGVWRKPCIVHVTMVANGRQTLFGTLSHDGNKAVVQKTPVGWALIHQQKRMLELCPEIKILADKVMPDHHHMCCRYSVQWRVALKRCCADTCRDASQKRASWGIPTICMCPHAQGATQCHDRICLCECGASVATQAKSLPLPDAQGDSALWIAIHFIG